MERLDAVLNIRMPKVERAALDQFAASRKQSASQFARQAIAAVVNALRNSPLEPK
jgi:predicted transcriptional regulator